MDETKKVTDLHLEKIANGFEVRVCYKNPKGEEKWDTIDETYAFATVEEALAKVTELVKLF